MKRIVTLLLLCVMLTGCVGRQNADTEITTYTPEPHLLEGYSEAAIQHENKMVQCEKQMLQYIQQGRVLINEVDWKASDRMRAHTDACQVIREYHKALGTGGFRTDTRLPAIYPMGACPEDYYCWVQTMLSLEQGNSFYEYCVFFTKGFDNINARRWCTNFQGIFGVTISPDALQTGVDDCYAQFETVTQDAQYNHELYNQNGILIKVVAMVDTDGTRYIAIKSIYTAEGA